MSVLSSKALAVAVASSGQCYRSVSFHVTVKSTAKQTTATRDFIDNLHEYERAPALVEQNHQASIVRMIRFEGQDGVNDLAVVLLTAAD